MAIHCTLVGLFAHEHLKIDRSSYLHRILPWESGAPPNFDWAMIFKSNLIRKISDEVTMKLFFLSKKVIIASFILSLSILSSCSSMSSDALKVNNSSDKGTEIIVLIRHGEKPKKGLGQLSVVGLKRSLLLPEFFEKNFGKADFIFAPNPAVKHFENHGDRKWYCYVRPLATIQPTAITLGLPVDTTLGLNDTEQLVNQLLRSKYRNSKIYIAWEHSRIVDIANQLIKKKHATDIIVPEWHSDNYNMVFVFKIEWNKPVGKQLSFKVMSESLNNLAEKKVNPAYLN